MPTSDEIVILESQQQALKLKAQELKKQGVPVEKLKQTHDDPEDSVYNPQVEFEKDPANTRNFEDSFSKFEVGQI